MNNYSHYEKINKFGIFSPRFDGPYKRPVLNEHNIFGNFNAYSKFSRTGHNNNNLINIYYSPRQKEKPSKIPKILSPLHRKLNKIYRSSSQQNIKSRRLKGNSNEFLSLESFSFRKLKLKKSRNKNDNNKKYHYFNIEKEKLYQETNQIRKVAKILTKNLLNLKHENLMKEKQINKKQKKINDFILSNNDSLFETNIYLNNNIRDNNNNNNNVDINNILKDNNVNSNNNSQYDIGSMNSSINNNNINISIYSNGQNNYNNINSPTGNLYNKIKKEIRQMNTEIKTEKEKYEKIKKSLYLTKMNELSVESALLEEQIKKISSFITKAFVIQEENLQKRKEFINLRENIEKQEKIIKNLTERANALDKEEVQLRDVLEKGKINLDLKNRKIKINKKKLKILKEKNKNLFKDINGINQPYVVRINNKPFEIKSYFTGQISELNKLINFFNHQNKYYLKEMNKLKDRHMKLVNEDKKIDAKFGQKESELFSSNSNPDVTDNEKLEHLRGIYKEKLAEEKDLEKKLILYQNKLKEIENPDDDMGNGSQIEFGIDSENPYYTDDNENSPEISNKFTSWQFNQFTYILFKNFESKGISYEESKTKVIDPFIEFNNKNNVSNIVYPSNEFDFVVEEYTKIIMEVLNCDNNNYNYILTKIFMSALFFNSECDVNKLIEYFNILFSYTINYSLEEEKYFNKLKTKYLEQMKKLISCIKDNMPNGQNAKREKYIHLLKMKELLEHNDINLKDKYIEFIFYYMKKFEDKEAKLGDLKYSLLNDIIPGEFENSINNDNNNNQDEYKDNENDNDINIENNNNDNDNDNNDNKNENNIDNNNEHNDNNENEVSQKERDDDNIDNLNKGKEKEKEKEKNDKNKKRKIDDEIDFENANDNEFERKEIKSVTEDNLSQKHNKNNIDKNEKENSDDMEEDEDSMTEITNEEYVKQIKEAITLIEKGIKEANTNFNDLMANVIQKRKITGNYYECITIEDFNDQLKSINVILSDLKLSCLCSKYSIPNELRLIDKNKIDKDIQNFINGSLKLDEEENNS